MKKIVFYLGHPAHFHLFKNTIQQLKELNYLVFILIKKKDTLEKLLENHGFQYTNILKYGRKNSKVSMASSIVKQDAQIFKFCLSNRPDILIGTPVAISHIGKLLNIPTITVNEDDANVVPLNSKLSYPFTRTILSPTTCNNSKWERKSIKYKGYHELAYLHPNNFNPEINICRKYFSTNKPYFILRFSGLNAHHDKGVSGINDNLAIKLVNILKDKGNVFITSERLLIPELEKYRKAINPLDIHHILAFATLYIGDSQTMAAEAGVLGTPFIRYNDFVGRIGYLNELENEYNLGYGFKTNETEEMIEKVKELIDTDNLHSIMKERKEKMLEDKIDLAAFLTWFIENYPGSIGLLKENPEEIYNKYR